MEKIYILGPDGQYEDASVLENAIKETIKRNERKRTDDTRECDGDLPEDKGETGELAPDESIGRTEDSVG